MGNKSGSYDLGDENKTLKEMKQDVKRKSEIHNRRLVSSSTIRRKTDYQTGAGEVQWEGEAAANGDLIRASSCGPIHASTVTQTPHAAAVESTYQF